MKPVSYREAYSAFPKELKKLEEITADVEGCDFYMNEHDIRVRVGRKLYAWNNWNATSTWEEV